MMNSTISTATTSRAILARRERISDGIGGRMATGNSSIVSGAALRLSAPNRRAATPLHLGSGNSRQTTRPTR